MVPACGTENTSQDSRARRAGRARLAERVDLVHLVSLVQPNKLNRPSKQIKQAVLACLARHAPRPVALADFLSILLDEDVPHDGLGQGDRSWMDSPKFDRGPPRPYNDRLIRVSS